MTRKSVIVGVNGQPLAFRNAIGSAYESAGTGRRTVNLFAPGSGPNAALIGSLASLRNRSRAGYRNNPWIGHGINRLVSNEIGTGIIPRSRATDEAMRKPINRLWDRVNEVIDADGQLDFYGLQTLISRTRNMAGEVFIRRRARRLEDGFPVPMQVQVLEPEFCPESLTQKAPNGNQIKAGIEFDRLGRRAAYWMYREHPQDNNHGTNLLNMVRVPASEVIHHYVPLRPGQIRGEPVTAQALLKAFTFDSYDDAELKRKETKSSFTGFIKKNYEAEEDWLYDPVTGQLLDPDSDGVNNVSVQAGTMLSGLPGEEPVLFEGDNTGSGYADFMRQQLQGIAVGLEGIPYEILSGDWSKVNDRLVRAILHEFRRGIEAIQDQYMIHQVCRTVWGWVMDAAVLAGEIDARAYAADRQGIIAHEWRPQGWPYLQPQTDITAKKDSIKADLSSLEAEVAKSGWDLEDIQDQNIAAEKRMVEKRREAGLPDYPPGYGATSAPASVENEDDTGDTQTDDVELSEREKIEAYGVGVRAGVITPQPDDEEVFRGLARLPGMTQQVRDLWEKQGGFREPVTLRGGEQPPPTDQSTNTNSEPA